MIKTIIIMEIMKKFENKENNGENNNNNNNNKNETELYDINKDIPRFRYFLFNYFYLFIFNI